MIPRSALYVPADDGRLRAKALGAGADVVIVDLEDAVAQASKAAACIALVAWLHEVHVGNTPEVWIRVNPGEAGLVDIAALTHPTVAGFCLAKVDGVEEVRSAHEALDVAEGRAGIEIGRTRLELMIETARAVVSAVQLAGASPRVRRLQLGEADLSADLGVAHAASQPALDWCRGQVLVASAAVGLESPFAPVSGEFSDLDAVRAQTERFRDFGFTGRACIHPNQVAIANEVFSPSVDELRRARSIVERFEQSDQEGHGVTLDEHGRLVDMAVVRGAQRVLERERSCDGRVHDRQKR